MNQLHSRSSLTGIDGAVHTSKDKTTETDVYSQNENFKEKIRWRQRADISRAYAQILRNGGSLG